MSLGLSIAVRNNRLTQILNALDAQTAPGFIEFYNGGRPSTGGTATILLATCTLSKPSASVANGILTFNSITDGTGTAGAGSGTSATWARIKDGSGNFVADCSVGTTGADINLNSTIIATDQTVAVTSATITEGNA
jgi:hypothetical protein